MASAQIEELPSMLWVAVPSVILVSAYFVRKWYLGYRLRTYGIGRGAEGFQTGVRRVRVTPEIAARIQRGEDVSPAEIEAASREMDRREALEAASGGSTATAKPSTPQRRFVPPPMEDEKPFIDSRTPREPSPRRGSARKEVKTQDSVDNEWLPENVTNAGKAKKRGRKA